jgi:type IV pilus biogenesis protein PilP
MRNERSGARVTRATWIGLAAVALAVAQLAPTTAVATPAADVAATAGPSAKAAKAATATTAAPVIPAAERNTADELTRLQEQTVLLQAQLRMLEARAEVAARTQALEQMGDAASVNVGRNAPPRVVSIEGLDGRYSAMLQTADGERFDVRAGDTLPDGLHVASIASNRVTVRHGGHSLQLVPSLDDDVPQSDPASLQSSAAPVPLPARYVAPGGIK